MDYHDGTLLKTQEGLARGAERKGILVWKGIPYAQAPVGELRWKAPEKPVAYTDVLDATKPGNIAIQGTVETHVGSEDCLNLDIYRPDTSQKNLPILVYLHGGNNQTGDSSLPMEKFLVKADVVFISLNYRLGVLGFNNLPALQTGNKLEDSGNYTLLDIARALDWVKGNAAAFGGDPDNITISGFSAGGRDVMAMLTSPIYKGKFQKAISLSGGMTMSDPVASQKIIASKLADYVVEDGIKTHKKDAYEWLLTKDTTVRDYLYTLLPERLAAAMGAAKIRMPVFPHLFADGVVLPKEQFATKNYISVPLIMLSGTNEFSLYAAADPYFKEYISDNSLLTNKEIRQQFDFATKYGSKMYCLFNAEESAVTMFDNYHAPIYTCLINYGNDPTVVGEEMAGVYGATHGIWIPFVTGERDFIGAWYPQSFANKGAEELTDKIQTYFKNFLWTGDPNGNGLVQWEKWTDKKVGPSQIVFDATKNRARITMKYTRMNYDSIIREVECNQSIPDDIKAKLIHEVMNGRWFSKGFDVYFHNSDLWQVKDYNDIV